LEIPGAGENPQVLFKSETIMIALAAALIAKKKGMG